MSQQLSSEHLSADLDSVGYTVVPSLLDAEACADLRGTWSDDALFRSTVVMEQRAYGQGTYRYYRYPLPPVIAALRQTLYPRLAPLANTWAERMGQEFRYPDALEDWLAQCHDAGQVRPTPLILHYGPGDYNHLHQDLYGDLHFPLQVAVLLSRPDDDFTGGEFVLTEQRPRQQSRVEVVPLGQGDAVVFAVNKRPIASARDFSRVTMRHGVSRLRRGERFTLGIIFHDAA